MLFTLELHAINIGTGGIRVFVEGVGDVAALPNKHVAEGF